MASSAERDAQDAARLLAEGQERMHKTIADLQGDLAAIRTGRAHPALVEHLRVTYYGTPTPLNQLATISVPEARVLAIQPWDRAALVEIEKAIQRSDLGITPNNDGSLIRLNMPPLNEERRRELVRQVKRKVEEHKVALRNIRRDVVDALRDMERRKEISEDEQRRAAERMQKTTDGIAEELDQLGRQKEAEILEV
jgi:ribosome recycling factor